MIRFVTVAIFLLTPVVGLSAALKSISLTTVEKGTDGLLNGSVVQTKSGAEFVKLAMVFMQSMKISKVAVDSCKNAFNDGVEFFFWPGFASSYAEAGKKTASVSVDRMAPIRTLAVVFGNNKDVCLSSIKVWDENEQLVSLTIEKSAGENQLAPASALASTEVSREVIDKEYTNRENGELWRYRFRSDGSFFIRGFGEDTSVSREFSALGRFKVIESSKKKMKFELSGFRYSTPQPWDGLICSIDCGISEVSNTPVKETLEIERTAAGTIFVRNRSERSSRTLPFSDLKVRPSTLAE